MPFSLSIQLWQNMALLTSYSEIIELTSNLNTYLSLVSLFPLITVGKAKKRRSQTVGGKRQVKRIFKSLRYFEIT